jgi:hypothetical protein
MCRVPSRSWQAFLRIPRHEALAGLFIEEIFQLIDQALVEDMLDEVGITVHPRRGDIRMVEKIYFPQAVVSNQPSRFTVSTAV